MPEACDYTTDDCDWVEYNDSLRENRLSESAVALPFDDTKQLYRQSRDLSLSEVLQDNWPQIYRHELHELKVSIGKSRVELDFLGSSRTRPKPSKAALPGLFQSNATQTSQRESFVQRAQRLDEQGRVDAALDLIYDASDEILRNGQFPRFDSLLEDLPATALSVDILLGLLTVTLPARSQLSNRKSFYRQVEGILRDRGVFEDGILTGLE